MPRATARSAAVTALLAAAATAVYYVIPIPGRMQDDYWAIMFFAGTAGLGVLILLAIRRLLREAEGGRTRGLILLLTLTVLFFSWSDKSVAALPGQFAGLHTRTDALYFNMSTLATVGFGDVHPVGQLARAAVTLQIVFNLVFLGAAVSMITGFMRRLTQRRLQSPGQRAGGEARGPAGGEATGPAGG